MKITSNLLLKLSIAFTALFISIESAQAFDWRRDITYGLSTGLGNASIEKSVLIQDTFQPASRNEQPLMLQLSIEAPITDKITIGLRHNRGVRLGPFSSGVSFTGLVGRYYFGNRPYLPSPTEKSSVTQMGWALFAGGGAGLALADTTRERELVADVKGSGAYVGINVGADYHMFSSMIFRAEVVYSTTLFDDTEQPSTLTEMGLMLGVLFRI